MYSIVHVQYSLHVQYKCTHVQCKCLYNNYVKLTISSYINIFCDCCLVTHIIIKCTYNNNTCNDVHNTNIYIYNIYLYISYII